MSYSKTSYKYNPHKPKTADAQEIRETAHQNGKLLIYTDRQKQVKETAGNTNRPENSEQEGITKSSHYQ